MGGVNIYKGGEGPGGGGGGQMKRMYFDGL